MNQQAKRTHAHQHTCKIISVTTIINIHIYALFIFEIDFECHIATAASHISSLNIAIVWAHQPTRLQCRSFLINSNCDMLLLADINELRSQSIQLTQFKCLIFICQQMSFNLSHRYCKMFKALRVG